VRRLTDRLLTLPHPRLITNRISTFVLRVLVTATLPFARRDRISVVIVNWNTLAYLRETLEALERFSHRDLEVIVVDNGSTDGSVEFLRANRSIRTILFSRNIGHAKAADLGFLVAGSAVIVSLDVDAFPTNDSWMRVMVDPLAAGNSVSGARLWRPFVHPCCLAMRKSSFVLHRHTFRSNYSTNREELGHTAWDVGESISMREIRRGRTIHLVDKTSQRGPGDVGTVFGDCVYHNFYSARHQESPDQPIDGVAASDATAAWDEAVVRYLRR
jgi:glycosyltransferase involved in cell wall biosynthesis